MTTKITIYKLDSMGNEILHYEGILLERTVTTLKIEAYYTFDKDAGYVTFQRGDRSIEWFYTDRWYNIFEIRDVQDDHLKGWYCNICRPALLEAESIRADDLALDLWIDPLGNSLLLDQDEFDALPLDEQTREHAKTGLAELLTRLAQRESPFENLPAQLVVDNN